MWCCGSKAENRVCAVFYGLIRYRKIPYVTVSQPRGSRTLPNGAWSIGRWFAGPCVVRCAYLFDTVRDMRYAGAPICTSGPIGFPSEGKK